MPAARAVRLYYTGIRLKAGIRCHPYCGKVMDYIYLYIEFRLLKSPSF
jgi:hypothetical protein